MTIHQEKEYCYKANEIGDGGYKKGLMVELRIALAGFCLLASLTVMAITWLDKKGENRFKSEIGYANDIQGGTEINIRVRPGGETSVFLRHGEVCLTNPEREVCLRAGEAGYAAPGKGPVKESQAQGTILGEANFNDCLVEPLMWDFTHDCSSNFGSEMKVLLRANYEAGLMQGPGISKEKAANK